MLSKEAGQRPLGRRKGIFWALVEAQDKQMDTILSRQLIANRFEMEVAEVRRIEEEGLQGEWPPL